WLVSPEIARRISLRRPPQTRNLKPEQLQELRCLARRTWLFFETFVGPDDNWLPPDNFQEEPGGEIAHRTSPTNIGMMLLSTLSAHDLGYLGMRDLAIRVRSALEATARMEHYRGHLLNWYDTRSLEPLLPRYVSTVDSGNLLGALVLMRQACTDLANSPPVDDKRWRGLQDGVHVLREVLDHACRRTDHKRVCRIGEGIDQLWEGAERAVHGENDWPARFAELDETSYPQLVDNLKDVLKDPDVDIDRDDLHSLRTWLARLQHDIGSIRKDLDHFAPWAVMPARSELGHLLQEALPLTLPLRELPAACERGLAMLQDHTASADEDTRELLADMLRRAANHAIELLDELEELDARLAAEIQGMDFRLLYDPQSHLFHIGHNVTANRLDPNHYDLLASEARIASLLAIAKGDVPLKHWSFLRRPFARMNGHLTLLSWGGTMFEYLMPNLFIRPEGNSLLAQTCRGAVASHIAYARRRNVPWGISESAYANLSADKAYHYKVFGVPGLGIKRGLEDDLVVSPYASVLAVSVDPAAVMDNLGQMRRHDLLGMYGFFEAGDFTPSRLAPSQRVAVVRCYMAHHQGMILIALNNFLSGEPMPRRFLSDPMVRTAMILLEEGSPQFPPVESQHFDDIALSIEDGISDASEGTDQPLVRHQLPAWSPEAGAPHPQAHILSNGRFTSMLTDSGAGYMGWRERLLTRWRPDTTLDCHGVWVYARDEETNDLWSVSQNPTNGAGEFRVFFHPHMVEFDARAHDIFIRMEVVVPPAHDMEIRRVVVTNETDRSRTLTLTTYGEVVLTRWVEHERHPAFSKLFVQTSYHQQLQCLMHERRPRSPEEPPLFLLHRLVHDDDAVTLCAAYAERSDFLGRWGDPSRPGALEPDVEPAWPQDGATLDPILGLQARVSLPPHGTANLAFITIAGSSREQVLQTARHNASCAALQWLITDAHHATAKQLQTLELAPEALPTTQRLLAALLYPSDARTYQPTSSNGHPSRQALWATGVSGDRPILVLRVCDESYDELLKLLLGAHAYWRERGTQVDLVILREGVTSYEDSALSKLRELVTESTDPALLNREGGVFLIQSDQVHDESRDVLLQSAAVVLNSLDGPIADQLRAGRWPTAELPPFAPSTRTRYETAPQLPLPRPEDLQFDNGLGGFADGGREYVIYLRPGQRTPAPWCNVLANRRFGCLVSEAGLGHTWAENSSENRLTPWRNDPVTDLPAEIVYLRDEESAEVWTPTPMPAGQDHACRIHHAPGHTEYHCESHQLGQRLRVFVVPEDPVKIVSVQLTNRTDHPRRLTCTYYLEWVLGSIREPELPHISADYADDYDAVLVRNPFHRDCPDQLAFVASDLRTHGLTVDRQEFLGRNGRHDQPAALLRWGLSGETNTRRDPCTALQVHIDLAAGEAQEFHFFLGDGRDREEACQLIRRYRRDGAPATALLAVQNHWRQLLDTVQVATPDRAMDVMLNGWLLYQSISSRQLARTGFYQSSGAFGFRDQLQDVLPLSIVEPTSARDHILETARHQFQAGDAVHWWHPPDDHGLRTRCSDDMLWLPYCTSEYVRMTGDTSILEETVPFLQGDPLAPDERDRYAKFQRTRDAWSILEHCRRAAEQVLTTGPRGLPLIRDGDWNDGMNRVGAGQHGESVWLGWFGYAVTTRMAELSETAGDPTQAHLWRQHASQLAHAVETAGWDGSWYRRAFYDDGTPIGSTTSDECRVDSIAQSWAVLSGGGDPQRVRKALTSAKQLLFREDQGLALLLWPPFSGRIRDPGYIAAYPPGIRENGGQYSHAATWLGCALAEIGDSKGAKQIFDCVNPIRHACTPEDMLRYRVEPYVVAGDIYSVTPYAGRGGWTWYTGAASWTWRLGVEWILGLRLRAGKLHIDPCIPPDWPAYEATVQVNDGSYHVKVRNPDRIGRGVAKLLLNGSPWSEELPLPEPGQTHEVEVHLGK
ncbi:MAG: GH36-type glycosyl hydrolase domain-containing protein, partial [Planctomycetota bacterium]